MAHVSREQWEQKGRELFGEDQTRWRFVCPACGREHSIAQLREELTPDELAKLRGGFSIESECIGRYLPERADCDWCAYGLFRGPVVVRDGARELAVFDFAGKPFTEARASA